MKKQFVLAALTLGLSAGAFAQTPVSKSTTLNPGGWYVKGGLNLANISTSKSGSVNNSNNMLAFNAGFIGDIPIADMFSIQTGLLLNQKGAKSNTYLDDNNHNDNYSKYSYRPLYLEVPVNFVVKIPIGTDARIYAGAGPYAAVGIGGNYKVRNKFLGVESSNTTSIKYTSDDIDGNNASADDAGKTRRFDFGLNALAGVEIQRFVIGAGYGFGITKINAVADNDDDRNKHRVASLSIGYRLF